MNPWEQLEHEVELALHPTFADRLLDGVLESENMLGAYGAVADLVPVLRQAATEAELSREAETVAEMARIRRAARAGGRTYGRKSLAVVAAAAAMSTSVAWASGVPPAIQEATAQALAHIGAAFEKARGGGAAAGTPRRSRLHPRAPRAPSSHPTRISSPARDGISSASSTTRRRRNRRLARR